MNSVSSQREITRLVVALEGWTVVYECDILKREKTNTIKDEQVHMCKFRERKLMLFG